MFDPIALPSGEENAGSPPPMDPEIAQMASGLQADSEAAQKNSLATMREKQGIVLHCVDGSKPTVAEEPTRLYVKKLPDAGYADLKEAVHAEGSDQHREMQKTNVDLPVGKVMRMTAQGRNRIGDEECHVSYIFVDGKDAYILRLASTNAPDSILSIEAEVAKSFRVRPKTK